MHSLLILRGPCSEIFLKLHFCLVPQTKTVCKSSLIQVVGLELFMLPVNIWTR